MTVGMIITQINRLTSTPDITSAFPCVTLFLLSTRIRRQTLLGLVKRGNQTAVALD